MSKCVETGAFESEKPWRQHNFRVGFPGELRYFTIIASYCAGLEPPSPMLLAKNERLTEETFK
jgi:hypothetical protein